MSYRAFAAQAQAANSSVVTASPRPACLTAARTVSTVAPAGPVGGRREFRHRVPRPFGRHLLGAPLLARAGRRVARRFAPAGYRVLVNGGNCRWPDANWVHYVHAATAPPRPAPAARPLNQPAQGHQGRLRGVLRLSRRPWVARRAS